MNQKRIPSNSLHPINDGDEIGIGVTSNPAFLKWANQRKYFIFVAKKLQNVMVINDTDDEAVNTHNAVVRTEADSSNTNASPPDEGNSPSSKTVTNNAVAEILREIKMAVQEQSVQSEPQPVKPEHNVERLPPESTYKEQESYIVIDDDDEFVCSQLFSVNTVKKENEENCLSSDSMFCNIKKELEEMNQMDGDLAPVEVNSNSDFNILTQLEDAIKDIDVSLVVSVIVA